MRPRSRAVTRADVPRWLGLWGFVFACAFALGRTDGATLLGLTGTTALSLFATRRPRLRVLGLGFPVVALGALTLRYALHPAAASALFSIGILGAWQLSALVWVHAVLWRRADAAEPGTPAAPGVGLAGVVFGRLLLLTLAGTAAFLVGEVAAERAWPRMPHGIRALEDSPVPAPYVEDPELQHVHAPGFRGTFVHPEYGSERFETNTDGFRDAAWPADPPAEGDVRVLLLGDSTTVGFGARGDRTIAAVLEALLTDGARADTGTVRVLNGGVAGYSPCHAELLLARLIERVRPTHVVCIAYDGNDLEDCRTRFVHARNAGLHDTQLPSELAAGDRSAVPEKRGAGTLFGRTYWYRYSALYRRLEPVLLPVVARAGWVEPDHAYAAMLRVTRVTPAADVAEELDLAADAVRGLGSLCSDRSIPFTLVRLPARVQTEPGSFDDLLRRYGADPARHDRTLPGRALLERAAQRGIVTLDLLPLLEVEGHGPNPLYYLEGHPNPDGNRAIAEALRAVFDAQGWSR